MTTDSTTTTHTGPAPAAGDQRRTTVVHTLIFVGVVAALIWSYWPVLTEVARDWSSDEDYSSGVFVPLVALYILWSRRSSLMTLRPLPCWWGLGVIVLAEYMRYVGLRDLRQSVERYAFVLELAGVTWLVLGTAVTRRVVWILAFLPLMFPLPLRVHTAVSNPMQTHATSASKFILELLDVTVSREGNLMTLNDRVQVGVVEACSGLRMLMTFLIVAAFLAMSIRRPFWQKAVLVASSVGVAMVCNIVRIVATALMLLATDGSPKVERFFHDFAGYAMMPVAIVLLLAELWFLNRIVIPDEPTKPPPGRSTATAGHSAEVSRAES